MPKEQKSLKDFDNRRRKDAGGATSENVRPLAIFDNSYDHYGYGNDAITQGMEHIKVIKHKKIKEKTGRKCEPGDWVTAHYKTFNKHDEKLEDTKSFKKGKPKNFPMGHYQVPKCWEIALTSLKAGERIKMECPAFYAYGGEEKYGHFGSVKIPANSDLIFELDVLNCEASQEDLDQANANDNNGAIKLTGVKTKKKP